jgi:hypothetical protein
MPTPGTNTVVQNQRMEANPNVPLTNGGANPRMNNNTVQNPVNPRGQGFGNANVNPRMQPSVPESTGRNNVIRNQNETVRGNNNVSPERNVMPVRSQQANRTEPKVTPQTQQVRGNRNQGSPVNQRVENNVQRNVPSVDARQSNPGRQKEQRVR